MIDVNTVVNVFMILFNCNMSFLQTSTTLNKCSDLLSDHSQPESDLSFTSL